MAQLSLKVNGRACIVDGFRAGGDRQRDLRRHRRAAARGAVYAGAGLGGDEGNGSEELTPLSNRSIPEGGQ